jgi:hypothetical protein
MRTVAEWQIQVAWWVSGIFATGAVWYFLSTGQFILCATSSALALLFAGIAIHLHRRKDAAAKPSNDTARPKSQHQADSEINAANRNFERLAELMPELFAEIRKDLSANPALMLREFVILPNERITFNHGQPRIEIYETKHPAAKNQVGVLLSEGLVDVVRSSETPIYRLTEAFVQRLVGAA